MLSYISIHHNELCLGSMFSYMSIHHNELMFRVLRQTLVTGSFRTPIVKVRCPETLRNPPTRGSDATLETLGVTLTSRRSRQRWNKKRRNRWLETSLSLYCLLCHVDVMEMSHIDVMYFVAMWYERSLPYSLCLWIFLLCLIYFAFVQTNSAFKIVLAIKALCQRSIIDVATLVCEVIILSVVIVSLYNYLVQQITSISLSSWRGASIFSEQDRNSLTVINICLLPLME